MTVWPMVRLADVAEVIAGQSPEGRHYNTERDGLPFYQGKKDFGDRWIAPASTWTRVSTKTAERGDILMSVRAPVGPVNLAAERCCIGRGLAAIRPSSRVLTDFLFYYLRSIQDQIAGNEGAVFASINKAQIGALEIPLPPLDEQKRIVAKLDELRSLHTSIQAAWAMVHSNLYELSQSGINSALDLAAQRSGERQLGEIFNIARGGSPRPIRDFLTDSADGVNWIKISDATRTGKYITDTKQRIRPEGVSRSRLVHPGDFLLSNSMSFGRPYILETEGCIHDGWLVLQRSDAEFDIEYMYYALGSDYVYAQFDSLAQGSTVRNLNIESASKAKVPFPSLSEQRELAARFREIDECTAKASARYEAKSAACRELHALQTIACLRGAA